MYREHALCKNICDLREFKTKDIVKRLGILAPNNIHLRNFPIDTPHAIFNATGILENDIVKIYARIITGYYMYISSIVKIEVLLDDILSGTVSNTHYSAEIIIKPDVKQDIYGCEDPRAFKLGDEKYMIYTGRTIWYFNPVVRRERTLPVLTFEDGKNAWRKLCVFVHEKGLRENVISDKDSIMMKVNDEIFLLHRPHVILKDGSERHYCTISKFDMNIINRLKKEETRKYTLEEVLLKDSTIVLKESRFERKIGWGTPPIEIEKNRYIMLLHGVDEYIEAYRAFAAMFEYRKEEGLVPIAVTRYYIFEPKEIYELYGDRPYVVFPCGIVKVNRDEILIIYGAADYFTGFGLIDLNELLSELEKGFLE